MKLIRTELTVPGQQTGPSCLRSYLIDPAGADPGEKRPFVLLCPGGGYERRSDREGEPVALRFLGMGCHAGILDYSVAPNRFPTALYELSKAVLWLRSHGEEYGIDENRILICGFSAGGHLALSLGALWNHPFISETLSCAPGQIRPDGLILCYPVVTSGEHAHKGSVENLIGEDGALRDRISLEHQVGPHTPPVFLWHTWTDRSVPVENSLMLAAALRRSRVNTELHIYPRGIHGLALANEETARGDDRKKEPCCQSWIDLAQTWMHTLKFI